MRTAIALSITFAVLSTQQAYAIRNKETEVTFYAERALVTEVGSWELPCGTGGIIKTGRRTPFFVRTSSSCGQQAGPLGGATLSCHFTQDGCSAMLRVASRPRRDARRHLARTRRHLVR